ncbi:MAG: hypothetical protein K0T99_03765 [Alphaproteobacteria bacterium]|nr:hypothetical protein [Alphaproteobacteria bacterium]
MVVSVVGAGSWGSALASILSKNHQVIQYSRRNNVSSSLQNVSLTNNISDLRSSTHMLLVIPAQEIRNFLQNTFTKIPQNCKIIICSKGLESETGKLLSEIVEEFLPDNEIAVLSGPNFAKEIEKGLPASSSLAAKKMTIAEQIVRDLNFMNLKLYPTDEMVAVQIFGALKNVLAILCGFAQGLSLGENARASIITKGLEEITAFATEYNRKHITINNPGCVGDIILTCTSITSRNTKFGMKFADKHDRNTDSKNESHNTVEGEFTAKALVHLNLEKYPLLKFSSQLMLGKFNKNSSLSKDFEDMLFG